MVTLFRSGGLPTAEELRNSNAVWFDSLSSQWIGRDGHVGRSESVFMALREEDTLFWAELRLMNGRDATIYEVELPDDVMVNAYQWKTYDDAHRANDNPSYWGTTKREPQRIVDAYWLFGVTVDRFWRGYGSLWEGYDFPEEWEVKVPLDVAAVSQWSVYMAHDEVKKAVDLPDYILEEVV